MTDETRKPFSIDRKRALCDAISVDSREYATALELLERARGLVAVPPLSWTPELIEQRDAFLRDVTE